MPRIRCFAAWYDLWIGAYWDRQNRRLYVLPVPMLGIVFDFGAVTRHAGQATESGKPCYRWECDGCGLGARTGGSSPGQCSCGGYAWRKRPERGAASAAATGRNQGSEPMCEIPSPSTDWTAAERLQVIRWLAETTMLERTRLELPGAMHVLCDRIRLVCSLSAIDLQAHREQILSVEEMG